jgi:hypothetical protein
MRLILRNAKLTVCGAICMVLLGSFGYAATTPQKFAAGKKAKVTGTITSRNGDLVIVNVKEGRNDGDRHHHRQHQD